MRRMIDENPSFQISNAGDDTLQVVIPRGYGLAKLTCRINGTNRGDLHINFYAKEPNCESFRIDDAKTTLDEIFYEDDNFIYDFICEGLSNGKIDEVSYILLPFLGTVGKDI